MDEQAEIAARCRGIEKIYRRATGETRALKGIDAEFPAGRLTAVMGPSGIERVLNENDVLYFSTNSVAEALQAPSLQSLLWSLGLLQTLGIAAGVISLAGLVLYLQARERETTVVRALTRRMRLSSRGYRTMLVLEVSGLLGTAFVVGAGLGFGVSMLLLDRFDLNPDLPPSQLLEVPFVPLAITAVLVAGTALVSARQMQRRADNANVAELMRVV